MNVPIPTISRAISEEQMQRRFEADLKGDVELGSLRLIRWRISIEKNREKGISLGHLLSLAEKIESRWIAIKAQYGEGALLVEENNVSQMLTAPGGRFATEPHLLENARVLRDLKGQEWWSREHRLDSLLELVRA
ncbi:hypothetical protein [Rhizobium leguminosarum]|uniref:Uncharacterized protein n=1 Tax=Rhizobium leguminosarum TaxID=384 RepID=A0A2K9Z6L7_RHILE|nr:hypothetical protein [Rhizobium leguminosarum]AUW43878.1 hypothetical protein CUJ84_Chr003543 [Rhizobium leguminosarum]